MNVSVETLDKLLGHLNLKMVYAGVKPLHAVVCGGAALIALRLVPRDTEDVDIVALLGSSGRSMTVLETDSLPAEVEVLVAEVGREYGIREDWFNFGAGPLIGFGLPPGMTTRLVRRSYGACLTVYFISRYDQVHFKIYAAMHPKEGTRHLGDLLDLKPREDEVKAATSWLLGRKVSADFKAALREVLERIGYERIAEQI